MSAASNVASSQRLEFNPADPVFQADPYPTYALLRKRAPIYYLDAEDPPEWWLTRYDDVLAMLRDPRLSAEREIGGLQGPGVPEDFQRLGQMLGHMMLLKAEPDHQRLRGLVNKAFTSRVVERLRPRVETIVNQLLGVVMSRGQGSMDVIRDLATPLPVIVIAELLGVPMNDQGRFKKWSDDISVVLDGSVRAAGLPDAAKSAAELGDYLRHVVIARRREPREDLISAMIAARDREDALSDDELVSNCILLLLAGHETTTNLIGNGALALMRHPDQAKYLCENPGMAASAVEECLRYDAPIQVTSRVPSQDLEFRGVHFAKGIEVDLILGAANRDSDRFVDPDRFDIRRQAAGHLSFGHGAHFCLGAPLARLEGEIALSSLVRRMPRMELELDTPPRRPGLVLRGLSSLPVRF